MSAGRNPRSMIGNAVHPAAEHRRVVARTHTRTHARGTCPRPSWPRCGCLRGAGQQQRAPAAAPMPLGRRFAPRALARRHSCSRRHDQSPTTTSTPECGCCGGGPAQGTLTSTSGRELSGGAASGGGGGRRCLAVGAQVVPKRRLRELSALLDRVRCYFGNRTVARGDSEGKAD